MQRSQLDKFFDLVAHFLCFAGKAVSRFKDLTRRLATFRRVCADLCDVLGNILRAIGRLLYISANFVGRRALLFNGGGD